MLSLGVTYEANAYATANASTAEARDINTMQMLIFSSLDLFSTSLQ